MNCLGNFSQLQSYIKDRVNELMLSGLPLYSIPCLFLLCTKNKQIILEFIYDYFLEAFIHIYLMTLLWLCSLLSYQEPPFWITEPLWLHQMQYPVSRIILLKNLTNFNISFRLLYFTTITIFRLLLSLCSSPLLVCPFG